MSPASPAPARHSDLDCGKGIAIVLVVFGHLVARDIKPEGNDWYAAINALLYSFHMAFFFYLSGVVCFLRGHLPLAPRDYRRFLGARAERLLPAYLVFAALVFLGKWAAAAYISVDRSVEFSFAEAAGLILHPTASYASFLWYIVALLMIYALVPIMFWMVGNRPWRGVALAAALYCLPLPPLLALDQVAHYTLFFTLGGIWVLYRETFIRHLARAWPLWLAVFLLSLPLLPATFRPLVAGLLALPALHGLALALKGPVARGLVWLGRHSFSIYLMNTMAIGVVKGFSLKFVAWHHGAFLAYIPLLMAAGLFLPIVVRTWVFARIAWLDRITR